MVCVSADQRQDPLCLSACLGHLSAMLKHGIVRGIYVWFSSHGRELRGAAHISEGPEGNSTAPRNLPKKNSWPETWHLKLHINILCINLMEREKQPLPSFSSIAKQVPSAAAQWCWAPLWEWGQGWAKARWVRIGVGTIWGLWTGKGRAAPREQDRVMLSDHSYGQ